MKISDNVGFTVDTGLFRQLGELLVGRDSTALVELIKNAYDADATTVVLSGENLADPTQASLTIADNGTGMTEAQFLRGFLRVAARGKTSGERRSPLYRRRYTGEKGVGRLAAHKLAALLEVTTVAAIDGFGEPAASSFRELGSELGTVDMRGRLAKADHELLLARMDWDLIEAVETLAEVKDGLLVESGPAGPKSPSGTTLNLSRLRHAWTSNDLRDLIRQLHNFEPPDGLVQPLPTTIVPETLLFSEPVVRDADRSDPGLALELQGDFRESEEFWGSVRSKAEWVLEIRARSGQEVTFALTPTRVGRAANPFSKPARATMPHPRPYAGPFFDARILLRPGQVPAIETGWNDLNSGIRVYLEGFRVLPYGEPRNDWLSLDSDYTRRTGRFELNPLLAGPSDQLSELRDLKARDVSLRLMPNRAFFGAVFLTESGLGGLRTLVNREGFVPDEAYDQLVSIVGVGVRLLQRTRALASLTLARHEANQEAERVRAETASHHAEESNHREDENRNHDVHGADVSGVGSDFEPASERDESAPDVDEGLDDETWTVFGRDGASAGSAARLLKAVADLRSVLDLPGRADLNPTPTRVEQAVSEVDLAADRLIEDSSLLRVLASVGAQLSAFTHEVAQLVPAAAAAEAALAPERGRRWPPQAVEARRAVTEIRRALERQASYLVDVASTEGRRRRSRQRLAGLVEVAFLGFQGSAATRQVEMVSRIPNDLRTPPMFRAEMQAILTNLLSNAIKAAGSPGVVEVAASRLTDGVRVLVQNSGISVQPTEAEDWFVPYASTTTTIDPILGQGMGLGLPITRDLASEYGGTVRFISPSDGFATAVEVVIPE